MWGRRSNTNEKSQREDEEDTPQLTKKQKKMQWPPQFQTQQEFADDIDKAIKEHPPFGEWLLKHRNSKHVLISTGNRVETDLGGKMGMWDASLEELQAQYVESETRRLTREHMPKYFAKLHIEAGKARAESAKEALQLAKSAHAEKVANFEKMQKAGYHMDEPGECPGPNFDMVDHYDLLMMAQGKPRLCERLLREKQNELRANGVDLDRIDIPPARKNGMRGAYVHTMPGTHGLSYYVTTCGVWVMAGQGGDAKDKCAGYFHHNGGGVKVTEEMLQDVEE